MYIEDFSSPYAKGAAARIAPFLPLEAPLDMPEQRLDAVEGPTAFDATPLEKLGGLERRRLFLVLGSLLLGTIAAREMARPLALDGVGIVDAGFMLLFLSLFAWISFGFLSSLAGFVVMLGNGPGIPRWLKPTRLPVKRTAVLVPICNEEVGALFGRLEAMTASVAAIRAHSLFDFFVLSDSRAEAEPREIAAFRRLRASSLARIYYRRRLHNVARKPGNIGDWVRRFGGAYEHMIILDADSLMSGVAMARLATAMEERPGIGLIQTIPTIINARTLFARWQQFAALAYGSVASAGLQWWSGAEATFWGHNAIVRVRAFAESCGLPKLAGREPFGGHIMSHDMVEAALLRRRGWAVHMVTLPEGTYEEFPPTLVDHSIRDRRWCQGNLQHLRLLRTAGFHWVSRLQLLMGASAYLTSPLWLLLLVGGLAEPSLRAHGFAALPETWLLVLTGLLLLGPKLIALAWLGVDHDLRASLGGTRRVIASVVVEIPLSVLVAPVIMVNQTIAILDVLRGKPSGWAAQRRDADGLPLIDALRLYRSHIVIGALFGLAIAAGASGASWTVPVVVGLLVSPATAMLTSRCDFGEWCRRKGLFLSPHEGQPASRGGEAGIYRPGGDRFLEARWSRMFLTSLGPTLNP